MKDFNYKKKYGQNFLVDDNVKQKIFESISPQREDLIIEIGPGKGALTTYLKKYDVSLIGIEVDNDTKDYLSKLENNKTKFIFNDFLKIDINELLKDITYNNLFFVGNLPYYITTPIIEKIIDSSFSNATIVVMVQKEVAERFLAKPHTRNYGYITVLLNYYYNISKVVDAKKECFYPIPKVDSMVVKLTPKNKKENINIDDFKLFLKNAFKYKRKNLKNNLNGYDLNKIQKCLEKNNYSLNNRAEEIDLDTFIDLYNNL